MAKIAKNLTELIGRTPLMELVEYSRKYGLKQNIIAKFEARCDDYRAYQWKYRCGTGDGCYNQRISPDAHDARNHEYRAS